MELAVGLEPTASPLPRECSTPELRERGTERAISVQREIRAALRVPCEYSTGSLTCQSKLEPLSNRDSSAESGCWLGSNHEADGDLEGLRDVGEEIGGFAHRQVACQREVSVLAFDVEGQHGLTHGQHEVIRAKAGRIENQ